MNIDRSPFRSIEHHVDLCVGGDHKALLDWMINTQNVPMPRGRKE